MIVFNNTKELESWKETFDILQDPDEVSAIRVALKQKTTISHEDMLKGVQKS